VQWPEGFNNSDGSVWAGIVMHNKTPFNSNPRRFLRIGWPQLPHNILSKAITIYCCAPRLIMFRYWPLNFILAASFGCFHPISWRLPSRYCSSSVHTTHHLNFRGLNLLLPITCFGDPHFVPSYDASQKSNLHFTSRSKGAGKYPKVCVSARRHLLENFVKA
jgi:hypothetical protein